MAIAITGVIANQKIYGVLYIYMLEILVSCSSKVSAKNLAYFKKNRVYILIKIVHYYNFVYS